MKPWYLSKTIWANIIGIVIAILAVFTQSELLKDKPEIIAYILLASNVLNVILRALTDQAVEFFRRAA